MELHLGELHSMLKRLFRNLKGLSDGSVIINKKGIRFSCTLSIDIFEIFGTNI